MIFFRKSILMLFTCLLFLATNLFAKDDKNTIIPAKTNSLVPDKSQTKKISAIPKVIQQPADKPQDRAIRIKAHNGSEYCYAPTFTANESYVSLENCRYQTLARYDVLRRISLHVGRDTWLCLSAPYSVLNKQEEWDYIRLRPCAINDPSQVWYFKDGGFYSKVGNYRIKDYKYYLYISRNPNDYYDHSLIPNMKQWVETKAQVHSLNIKTTIGWYYKDKRNFVGKEIKGSEEPIYFFYNPENKHLFTFNQIEGRFECIISNSTKTSSWNWISTDMCLDTDSANNLKWDMVYQADLGSVFLDSNQHILRTPRYGPNWGSLYTVNSSYIQQDVTNHPTSYFVLDPFLRTYYKFLGGNLSKNLDYCPSPGANKIKTNPIKFPSDYNFDEDWLRLLYSIGISTDFQNPERTSVGGCGVCFLQTMEMIYQLLGMYPNLPVTPHLFAYNPNTDPFISFHSLFPNLFTNYQYFAYVQGFSLFEGEDILDRTMRVVRGTLDMTLGQYDFVYNGLARDEASINNEIQRILSAPSGSTWMVISFRRDATGTLGAHIQPVLSSSQGVRVVPVNLAEIDYETFVGGMAPTRDPAMIRMHLADGRNLVAISAIQVTPRNAFEGNLSALLSFYDCSGDGANARGSLTPLNSQTLNQCESGFCQ